MKFCIKEWRKIYDEVKRLGNLLKEGRPKFDDRTKNWIPSPNPMPKEEQDIIEQWIKGLLLKNSIYLDNCYMYPKEPLWKYSVEDKRTWASDKSFMYKKLLKKPKTK